MSDVIRTEISAVMDVGGTIFEIVQFGADFAINTIPSAEVVVAIGRKASDGTTAAAVHNALNKLTADSLVKVYFCPSGEWSKQENWPEGPHLIFEGRVVNTGYSKVAGKVQFVVRLIHWLADMNYSSAVSSLSHPSNPAQYTFQAIMSSALKTGGGSTQPAGLAGTSGRDIIRATNIQEDLWSRVLKPFFCKLGTEDTTRLDADLKTCFDLETNDNTAALTALSRIEGDSGDDCNKELSCYTPRLSLSTPLGSAAESVADSIAKTILFDSIQSYASTTLWGKLVGYTSMFGAAIIPMVDKALVVPFVPGIRSKYCKTIETCDYAHINISQAVYQQLRGIALIGNLELSTNVAPVGNRDVASLVGSGGCYAPEGVKSGMIKFLPTPPWLNNIAFGGHSPKKVLGIAGKRAISSATTPRTANSDELIANKDGQTREELITDTSDLFDAYARYAYVSEVLRGRFGSVSGKLRFDIAPGSSVALAGSAERFLQDQDALAETMVANVMRVSIGINAEASQVGTSFALSHVRTAAENKDDKYSVPFHPLYDDSFVGAPLIDALWFKEEGNNCC